MSFGIDELQITLSLKSEKAKSRTVIFDKGTSVSERRAIFLMGTNKTERPERLAGKLRRVRLKLGLSQTEMAEAFERYGIKVHRGYISFYENDVRVPPVLVALAYARLAKSFTRSAHRRRKRLA